MDNFANHLNDWSVNEAAFLEAFVEMQAQAAEVGLVIDRPNTSIDGFAYVLHAEVRPSGSLRVLASLDVGLSQDGEMLVQATPGGARVFSTFRPNDAEFYRRELQRLIVAAAAAAA